MSPRLRPTDGRGVEAAQAAAASDFAFDLLGRLSSVSSRKIRWGRKGLLILSTARSRAGRGHDFEHRFGGGMIDLIKHALDLAFPAAAVWGERWPGGRHVVFGCSPLREVERTNTRECPIRSGDSDAYARIKQPQRPDSAAIWEAKHADAA